MANTSKEDKITIKAIRLAIDNVFDEINDELEGTRSQKKKNKVLIKKFSVELIKNVVNQLNEIKDIAKTLNEVSVSITTFVKALNADKGEEVIKFLITETKPNKSKKTLDNKSVQEHKMKRGTEKISTVKKMVPSEMEEQLATNPQSISVQKTSNPKQIDNLEDSK